MTYVRLPRLSSTAIAYVSSGRQDRVELVVGNWCLGPATVDQIDTFIYSLTSFDGASPVERQSWFARSTGTGDNHRHLDVRSGGRGRGRQPHAPLLAGKIEIRSQNPMLQTGVRASRTLRLKGFINPTRYVNHQQHMPWATQDLSTWDLPQPSMVTRLVSSRAGGEFVLDDDDNVLLSRYSLFFGMRDWAGHLHRYWNALILSVQTQIEQAADHAGIHVELQQFLNVRSIETYWEFRAEDAVAWIVQAERTILSFGKSGDVRLRQYLDNDQLTETVVNSRRIKVWLRSGVYLRAYAKTNKRVRLEIVHELYKNARVVGGSHTSQDLTTLLHWFEQCTASAAIELNRLLPSLGGVGIAGGSHQSVVQLMQRAAASGGRSQEVELVLSVIAANGHVALGVSSALRSTIMRLERSGILRRVSPRHPNFVLTEEFEQAGQQLHRALAEE